MPQKVRLEVFRTESRSPAGAPDDTVVMPAEALEETRLAAFDSGYKAGWDDATAAAADTERELRAEMARNLQALSFTYHEARGALLQGLAPLMEQICTRLLPETARASLGETVRAALMPLAEEALERPVQLLIHPNARPALEAALADTAAPPHALVEDTALTPGEVYLRWDDGERHIDLDAAAAAIAAAVTAFFEDSQEELRHHG